MPKIVDHDARRIEILEGCFILFANQGYAQLSMRQLAMSLGVTTGTLYHYFSSKQQIFEELFRLLQKQDIQLVTAQFTEAYSLSKRLLVLKEFVLNNLDRLSNILKVALEYQRVQGVEESSIVITELVSGYKEAIAENLQIPVLLADTILSLIFGLLVQHIFNPEGDVAVQLNLGLQVISTLLE